MNRSLLLAVAAVAAIAVAAPRAQAQAETVHLVVTGGPNAGSYDISSDHGGCSYGLAGPGAWGNQISNPKDKDPKHFNSLQLIVADAKKAAGGTHDFFMLIGFGPLFHRGAEYTIETRSGKAAHGSGTVTVLDRGNTATVRFDVKAPDGVHFTGTIDCKKVIRAGK